MIRTILFYLLIIWEHQGHVSGIRLIELRVPTHKPEGGSALLGCQYEMEGDTLYSVKWYKGTREFYRYAPKNIPPSISFNGPGITVDMNRSSGTVVALTNLTQESAGDYSCEVSGEAPSFQTISRTKSIHIHLLPNIGPQVTGLDEEYKLGDSIEANCTLPPSRPEPHLKWLLNGVPLNANHPYVGGPWFRVRDDKPDGIESTIQLRFTASRFDFIEGIMQIKCQATIAPLYQSETKSTHFLVPDEVITLPTPMEASAPFPDHSSGTRTSSLVLLLIISVLIIIS